MDQSLGNRGLSALGLQRRQFGRRFARLLWTNNPFYLISAWLVFSGLRASFNTGGETFETWALLGGLAAYTLLLATAACVLVHLGRVSCDSLFTGQAPPDDYVPQQPRPADWRTPGSVDLVFNRRPERRTSGVDGLAPRMQIR